MGKKMEKVMMETERLADRVRTLEYEVNFLRLELSEARSVIKQAMTINKKIYDLVTAKTETCGLVTFEEIAKLIMDGEPIRREKKEETLYFAKDTGSITTKP